MVRFDHAVVLVEDLEAASAAFSARGFQVLPGGVHAGGLTRNVLIPFHDGSYLELLAFAFPNAVGLARGLQASGGMPWVLRGRTALDRRFLPRAVQGIGLIDWAVASDDMERLVAMPSSWWAGPYPGERRRPDGVRLAWQLAIPSDPVSPFVIRDVTDRTLRVPAGTLHDNGATGVAGITVLCADLPAARQHYMELLASEPVAETGREILFEADRLRVTLRPATGEPEGPVLLTLRDWPVGKRTVTVCGVRISGTG